MKGWLHYPILKTSFEKLKRETKWRRKRISTRRYPGDRVRPNRRKKVDKMSIWRRCLYWGESDITLTGALIYINRKLSIT